MSAAPSPLSDAADDALSVKRRRIYLMRHGSVDYFREDGSPVPPDSVPLNALGRTQADAAGALFASAGVRFDKVVASGLPRTLETAARVLAACGQTEAMTVTVDEHLQEIRGGRLSDLPREGLVDAFLGAFSGTDVEDSRFLGGESVGELLDRTLPAFERHVAATDWHCMLLVLHGGVNRALIGHAVTGGRAYFGRIEQAPACINVFDAAPDGMVVRAINLSPTQWLHERERYTTMEKLLAQFLRMPPV